MEEEPPELFAEPELLPEPDFFEVVALEEEPPELFAEPELLPEPDFFEVVALEEELPELLPEPPEFFPEPVFLPELPELLPEPVFLPVLPGWFAGVLELSGPSGAFAGVSVLSASALVGLSEECRSASGSAEVLFIAGVIELAGSGGIWSFTVDLCCRMPHVIPDNINNIATIAPIMICFFLLDFL